jgi:hypothetical protein
VEGEDLCGRPRSRHLAPAEDEGRSIPGRWVDSHHLQPGDVVICQDGRSRRIERVALTCVEREPVCNLTVRDHHTFAVGQAAVLVHNQAWCRVLEKVKKKPDDLIAIAKRAGFTESQVHAHHMVLKGIDHIDELHPQWAKWEKVKPWNDKSVALLTRFDVPLPGTHQYDEALQWADEIKKGTRPPDDLANLCWAINSSAVHLDEEYAKSVYEFLKYRADSAISQGHTAKSRIIGALNDIAAILNRGDTFRYDPRTRGWWGVPITK